MGRDPVMSKGGRSGPGRPAGARFDALVGVGGIGTGIFYALEGNHDLGRNETRLGRLMDYRDACKLHIIAHMARVLSGERPFHVWPVGKVGRDAAGDRLLAEMAEAGLDVRLVERVTAAPTLFAVCYQFPDGSGGNLTPVNAACSALAPADLEPVEPLLREYGARAMALAAPEVPLAARLDLLARATAVGAYRVASCVCGEMAEADRLGLFRHTDLLAVNEEEAGALTGEPFDPARPEPALAALAAKASAANPAMRVVLTAGPHGAYGFEDGRWAYAPAVEAPVTSTAGAGDTLLGGVLAWLAGGGWFLPTTGVGAGVVDSALAFGSLAAAYSVTRPDTLARDLTPGALRAFAAARGMRIAD